MRSNNSIPLLSKQLAWSRGLSLAIALAAAACASSSFGEPVSPRTVADVARGWQACNQHAFGSMGDFRDVVPVTDADGRVLWYNVLFEKGCAAVAPDDRIEPVIAVSRGNGSPIEPGSPLYDILAKDLRGRLAELEPEAGAQPVAPASAAPGGSSPRTKTQSKWDRLAAPFRGFAKSPASNGPLSDSPARIVRWLDGWSSPNTENHVQTLRFWNQLRSSDYFTNESIFNRYTPTYVSESGDEKSCACGCVATAGASVLHYFRVPSGGAGISRTCHHNETKFNASLPHFQEYLKEVELETMGGEYDWSLIDGEDLVNGEPLELREEAVDLLGRVAYDCGVGANMNYNVDGNGSSGTFTFNLGKSFREIFGMRHAQVVTKTGAPHGGEEEGDIGPLAYTNLIYNQIRAGAPVIMGIMGHEVVAAGYGIDGDGTDYTYVFLGWGSHDDAWFALPVVQTKATDGGSQYTSTFVDEILTCISLDECFIPVVGRIVDANGVPVAGANLSTSEGVGFSTDTNGCFGVRVSASAPSFFKDSSGGIHSYYFDPTLAFPTEKTAAADKYSKKFPAFATYVLGDRKMFPSGYGDGADTVISNFIQVASIPRVSHHEGQISAWLYDWAAAQGFNASTDAVGNVVFDVPATPGHELQNRIALQAHMDMVAATASGCQHDWDHDPIAVSFELDDMEEKVLCSENHQTSLGADNGIGVATAMAVAQGKVPHGPLRVIFTVDEEEKQTGAQNLSTAAYSDVASLINLDSEEDGGVTMSSASADLETITGTPDVTAPTMEKAVKLELTGFRGGHSGLQIGLGHLNAVRELAAVLTNLVEDCVFELASFDGGSAHNAIPTFANAVIVVDGGDLSPVEEAVSAALSRFQAAGETDAGFTVSEAAAPTQVVSGQWRDKFLGFVNEIIDGVHTMSPDVPGLVESSSNLGLVSLATSGVEMKAYPRSSVDEKSLEILADHQTKASNAGFSYRKERTCWPWPADPSSELLVNVTNSWKKLFGVHGEEMRVIALHAGLECGYFKFVEPSLDVVSIGTTIANPHTVQETCRIDTIARQLELLGEVFLHVGGDEETPKVNGEPILGLSNGSRRPDWIYDPETGLLALLETDEQYDITGFAGNGFRIVYGSNTVTVDGEPKFPAETKWEEVAQISDHLHVLSYDAYDYANVNDEFELNAGTDAFGACSSLCVGQYFGRNLDWALSDEEESFVLVVSADPDAGRHASIGVARGEYPEKVYDYATLPFYTMDGINDAGVAICANLLMGADMEVTTGTNPNGERLSAMAVVREVLDRASDVADAVELIESRDIFSFTGEDGEPMDLHFQICDRDVSVVVETADNGICVVTNRIMTNFYLAPFEADELGPGLSDSSDHTPNARGIERWETLRANSNLVDSVETMFDRMAQVYASKLGTDEGSVTNLWSDFNGMEVEWPEKSRNMITLEQDDSRDPESDEFKARAACAESIRNLWRYSLEWYRRTGERKLVDTYVPARTVHTSVYDLAEKTLSLRVDERKTTFLFDLDGDWEENLTGVYINGDMVGAAMSSEVGAGWWFDPDRNELHLAEDGAYCVEELEGSGVTIVEGGENAFDEDDAPLAMWAFRNGYSKSQINASVTAYLSAGLHAMELLDEEYATNGLPKILSFDANDDGSFEIMMKFADVSGLFGCDNDLLKKAVGIAGSTSLTEKFDPHSVFIAAKGISDGYYSVTVRPNNQDDDEFIDEDEFENGEYEYEEYSPPAFFFQGFVR